MTRIEHVLAGSKRKALIPYLTVGYPNIEATLELVPALVSGGCDMVELGIPFSDPLADGATIQRASYRALQQGVTPQLCLEVARKLRQRVDVPLLFMSYYNPLFHYGMDPFCYACADAGVDGLIVPDLPPEEGTGLEELTQQYQLDLVYLVSPTTEEERLGFIAARSRGFIYLVSLKGVTGARHALPQDIESLVSRLRERTAKPICVGFGISTPEQAGRVARLADGVIVGSRILDLVDSSEHPAQATASFVRQLREAIDGA
jgi:tryptophan synthase alpha chain